MVCWVPPSMLMPMLPWSVYCSPMTAIPVPVKVTVAVDPLAVA